VAKTRARQRFVHQSLLTDEERGLWRSFVTLHFSLNRQLDDELRREAGLTLPEYEVLWELTNAPDNRLRMNELARHLLFTRSGVTRLIDRLEAAGYVERDDCDDDGRGVYASITESGFATFEAAAVAYIDRLRELFFDPLKGDLRELRRMLARLTPEA
jgi:DNA-binding MarR family transcriptional regulator